MRHLRHGPALAALLAVLLLPVVPGAAAQARAPDFAAIDALVEARMEEARIPGAAIAIVQGDEIVHMRGFGRADYTGRPVTPETPFWMMSITKSFTATIVLQLAEEGKLALDDPVRRHIPWFAVADASHSDAITLRHLLSHTSGIPTLIPGDIDRLRATPRASDVEDEVRRLRDVETPWPPGERYMYSNAGFTVLALVIETVTGKSYEQNLEERLFGPLDMRQATTSLAEAESNGLAAGHRAWFGRPVTFHWSYSRTGTGAGFTMGSVEDLAKFATMALNGGAYGGGRILSEDSIALAHAPITQARPEPFAQHYGLGWFITEQHGAKVVDHAGVGPNYFAQVLLLPERGYAIALMMNANDVLRGEPIATLGPGIASILLGQEPERGGGSDQGLSLFRIVWAVDAVFILGLIVLARRARRAHSRMGATIGIALGAAWAAICLLAVPALMRWPLGNMWFQIPDFALGLTLGGILGALLVAAGAYCLLVRGRALARPSAG